MKKLFAAAAAATLAFAVSGPATAAIYQIDLIGYLTEQTGVDGSFALGDPVRLTARFSDKNAIQWGDFGYSVVGFYGYEMQGTQFFKLQSNGRSWSSWNEMGDGALPFYTSDVTIGDTYNHQTLAAWPAVMIADGKVIGLAGDLVPTNTSYTPILELGSSAGYGWETWYSDYAGGPVDYDSSFTPGSMSSQFVLRPGDGLYGNTYQGGTFVGVWDFANSSVAMVPEPATWAMMIMGFGLAGAALRRRQALAATA